MMWRNQYQHDILVDSIVLPLAMLLVNKMLRVLNLI